MDEVERAGIRAAEAGCEELEEAGLPGRARIGARVGGRLVAAVDEAAQPWSMLGSESRYSTGRLVCPQTTAAP